MKASILLFLVLISGSVFASPGGVPVNKLCYVLKFYQPPGGCQVSCVSKSTINGLVYSIEVRSKNTVIKSPLVEENAYLNEYFYANSPYNERSYEVHDDDSGYKLLIKTNHDNNYVEPFRGFKSWEVSDNNETIKCAAH